MDVDIVLNACLGTHQENELQRAQEASRRQKDIITKSMVAKLFETNGNVVCDITEFTVSQSRTLVPIYSIGNGAPVDAIPGRLVVTGTFQTNTNVLDLTENDEEYYIEADQLHPGGSSSRVRILHVRIESISARVDDRVDYHYTAASMEQISLSSGGNSWMST